MEPLNTLQLTDKELEMLSGIVRSFKLDLTSEDALLIALGKKKLPILDLTLKLAQAWEERHMALNNPKPEGTEQK